MKTQVIFRLWRKSVVALFPYEIADMKGNCLSYQHIGQHSAADYEAIISHSRPAIPAEYISLNIELENLGYHLEIIKRRNRRHYWRVLVEKKGIISPRLMGGFIMKMFVQTKCPPLSLAGICPYIDDDCGPRDTDKCPHRLVPVDTAGFGPVEIGTAVLKAAGYRVNMSGYGYNCLHIQVFDQAGNLVFEEQIG